MQSFVICSLIFTLISSNHMISNWNIKNDIISEHPNIIFESGEYGYKRWKLYDDYKEYRGSDCVTDIDTAMEIASSIMSDGYESFFENFELKYVFYDEIDNAWIVEFSPIREELEDGAFIVGGGLTIAISGKDARVLDIWPAE